ILFVCTEIEIDIFLVLFVCAAIDLTGIGNVRQQQWYGGIVYNLSESCQLEDKFDFDWQEWWEKYQTNLSQENTR
ncbi:MAG: hypothetical protein AAFQ23_11080, partial [Cyanobacteria bacterium J06623_1]